MELLPVSELNLTTFPWLMRVGGGNFNVGGFSHKTIKYSNLYFKRHIDFKNVITFRDFKMEKGE